VPNVQWKTLDDGQSNCPKHAEFLYKNKFGKLVRLLVLLKRKRNVRLRVRRLPADDIPLPKHVEVIFIMNCVSGFVF
jgi:ribosomal protein L4